MQSKIDKIISEFVKECKKRFGKRLVSIILFGSHARGTATKYSDIDLLIIARKLSKRKIDRYDIIFDILLDFTKKYHVAISPILLEPEEFSTQNITPLVYGILTGQKILYDKNNFWKKYLAKIKPIILEKKPIYVERGKKWDIAKMI